MSKKLSKDSKVSPSFENFQKIAQELHEDEDRWKLNVYRMSPYQLPYTIDVPPRYATGGLHVGHSLGYITIDIMARFKQMTGYSTFVPLCFDINGTPLEIATEKKFNITPAIGRDIYLERCETLARQNIETMSADFQSMFVRMHKNIRYATSDDEYRRLTQMTFAKLYGKRLIYREMFPVNWCVSCQTSLAEAEIEKQEIQKTLYQIDFGQGIIIATSRPELLGACQAVGVAPGFKTKFNLPDRINIPIYDRSVPVIEAASVDPAFGTGMIQVSIFGDEDDVTFALEHELDMSNPGIQDDGSLSDKLLSNLTISQGRQKIVEMLGLKILSTSLYQGIHRTCWRCGKNVEILAKRQWFLKTLRFKDIIKEQAAKIIWRPEFMRHRLEQWIDGLKWDWVISRQRFLATSIPIWECSVCKKIVVSEEFPIEMYRQESKPCTNTRKNCPGMLEPSQEVFDTWFDSSVTVLFNVGWENRGWRWSMENDFFRIRHAVPMSLRVQGHDIIRSWAFYTILRCHQLVDTIPFDEIWINGFIRSSTGEEMHASKGNTIRPKEFIEKYGADAYRFFVTRLRLGQDHLFQEQNIITGSHLIRKIGNIKAFIERYCSDYISKIRAIAQTYDSSWTTDKQKNFFIQMNPQNILGPAGKIILYNGENPLLLYVVNEYNEMLARHTENMNEGNFFDAMNGLMFFTERIFSGLLVEYVKYDSLDEQQKQERLIHTLFLNLIQMYAPFFPGVTNRWFKELGFENLCIHKTHRLYLPLIYASPIAVTKKPADIQTTLTVLHALRKHHLRSVQNQTRSIESITFDVEYQNNLLPYSDVICRLGRVSKIVFEKLPELHRRLIRVVPIFDVIRQKYSREQCEIIFRYLRQEQDHPQNFVLNEARDVFVPELNRYVLHDLFEFRYDIEEHSNQLIEIFGDGPKDYFKRIESHVT